MCRLLCLSAFIVRNLIYNSLHTHLTVCGLRLITVGFALYVNLLIGTNKERELKNFTILLVKTNKSRTFAAELLVP